MEKTTIGDFYYFSVPAGTIIDIPNPKWDGDDPTTHFNVRAQLDTDVTVCTTREESTLTILEIK